MYDFSHQYFNSSPNYTLLNNELTNSLQFSHEFVAFNLPIFLMIKSLLVTYSKHRSILWRIVICCFLIYSCLSNKQNEFIIDRMIKYECILHNPIQKNNYFHQVHLYSQTMTSYVEDDIHTPNCHCCRSSNSPLYYTSH